MSCDVSEPCSTAVYLSFIYLQISASISFCNEVMLTCLHLFWQSPYRPVFSSAWSGRDAVTEYPEARISAVLCLQKASRFIRQCGVRSAHSTSTGPQCWTIQLCFLCFLSLAPLYLFTVGVEGGGCTWSQSLTHKTLGMTALDEGSARRRDLLQHLPPPAVFDPAFPAEPRRRPNGHRNRECSCTLPGNVPSVFVWGFSCLKELQIRRK
jgi:hypothetical protein